MDSLLLKYNALDAASKKQVRDIIDQMLSKRSVSKSTAAYRKKLLKVSQWSDEDLKEMEDGTAFNFTPEEW